MGFSNPRYINIAIFLYYMEYRNLTIIGTSHIAKQSLDDVKIAIEEGKPGIVALELDRKRLPALMSTKKGKIRIYDIFRVGFKGFMFALIGAWAEKKLGEYVGVAPGSEMKQAVRLIDGKAIVEASGGVSIENIEAIAAAGVDYISVGSLTHSIQSLDISLEC